MKITNKVMMQSIPALDMISKLHLPVEISFDLAKLSLAINDAKDAYEATRQKLIEQHGKKDEGGKLITRTDDKSGQQHHEIENKDEFEKDIATLLGLEVDITGEQIKLATLGKGLMLPANVLMSLSWLIVK